MSVLVAGFSALLMLAACAGVGAMLESKRRDALAAESRQNTNLASAFTEQTLRVFTAIDQATLRARDAVAAGEAQIDLVRFANETGLAPAILVQLSLIDANGRFVGSNLDPDGSRSHHVDLSQREHVRVHLQPAPAARDSLFIGAPVLGKVSERWTVQLSRRIADAQGRTLGVVVASLDPGYFNEVYMRAALGRSGVVALIGEDHLIRASVVGGRSDGVGEMLPTSAALAGFGGQAEGRYVAPEAGDVAQERTVAFHRVGDYRAFVVVSTTTSEALADWRKTRDVMVAMTGVLSLVVLFAATAFVLGVRRLERTNSALQESQARARAASDAKTEFLAAMSHELRTPLTSIRGFAELLEARLPEPRFREHASLIRKGAERLNDLLTDILDMTKLEAGALALQKKTVQLAPLVHGVSDLFAMAADQKNLALRTQLAADMPQTLRCDPLRLRQILHHLLSNAIKFTPDGGVCLQVEGAGGELHFHVTDSGPGIPPDMREAVFEMFRQGSARVSFEHGGTGLGLAFCRSLARRMGGRLELQPSAGGAHFTLALPARDAVQPAV